MPEQTAHAILIVDLDRALRESAPGQALAAAIQKQRLAIHQSTVDLDKAMEAEETEIDQIRDRLTPQQFEERLRDFDQRVRQVRSERQKHVTGLQYPNYRCAQASGAGAESDPQRHSGGAGRLCPVEWSECDYGPRRD